MTSNVGAVRVAEIPDLSEDEIWTLARTEYRRMLELLRSLGEDDWPLPTECTAWTVRDVLGHLVGAAEGFSKPLELMHQYRAGAALVKAGETDGAMPVDGANAVQVRDRARASTTELLDRYQVVIEPVLRWRRRLRWLPMTMDDVAGRFSFRELFEVILTRDTWMHRLDVTRATQHPFKATPEHDGRLVADAVRAWARQHGHPFSLHLRGVAGGDFSAGDKGEAIDIEALDFMRALSGRRREQGLLATRIVF